MSPQLRFSRPPRLLALSLKESPPFSSNRPCAAGTLTAFSLHHLYLPPVTPIFRKFHPPPQETVSISVFLRPPFLLPHPPLWVHRSAEPLYRGHLPPPPFFRLYFPFFPNKTVPCLGVNLLARFLFLLPLWWNPPSLATSIEILSYGDGDGPLAATQILFGIS